MRRQARFSKWYSWQSPNYGQSSALSVLSVAEDDCRAAAVCGPRTRLPAVAGATENAAMKDKSKVRVAAGDAAERGGSAKETVPNRLLDVRAVANLLACGERSVWKAVAAERFPRPVRMGRSVRWRARDLDRFIAAGCDWAEYIRQGEGGEK